MIFNQECPPRFPSTVEGRTVMSVIIGIDPHKALHAACVIDRTETELCQLQGSQRPASAQSQLLAWAAPFESSDVGDRVRWRARLSARPAARRARRARRRCAGDVVVAGAAAGVGPVEQERRERRPGGRDRGAARHRRCRRCAARITSVCCGCWPRHSSTPAAPESVRAAGCTRWCTSSSPVGSARKSLSSRQNSSSSTIVPVTATQRQRLELAHEPLDEIRLLDAKLKRSKAPHHRGGHRVRRRR